jgi:hypothetical protein
MSTYSCLTKKEVGALYRLLILLRKLDVCEYTVCSIKPLWPMTEFGKPHVYRVEEIVKMGNIPNSTMATLDDLFIKTFPG